MALFVEKVEEQESVLKDVANARPSLDNCELRQMVKKANKRWYRKMMNPPQFRLPLFFKYKFRYHFNIPTNKK